MNFFRRFSFNLAYYRRPPWDTGVVPPEVEDYIATHAPAIALDLGCGSGTSSLALAKAGWSVTGVDFAARAIAFARRKARQSGLRVDFRVADVIQLPPPPSSFDLILDIGCFHSLSLSQRVDYLHNLDHMLAPGGDWLMYGFFKPDARPGPGLRPADIELAELHLNLVRRQNGMDRKDKPSAWFWFQKS